MATNNKANKLAFLSMPAPASYVAGLGRGASGFTTRSDIGPAREGPSAEVIAEAQAKRGEETEVDPDQFQDPDNEYGLFAGTTYEADDEEADRIYEQVDHNMDARRRARREALENEELSKHRAERPKIQQQFADLKRGLAVVTDEEWESIPEVGNLTRKKRKRDERSFVVPDSVIVGDRSKTEYENALDSRQQSMGGFETPADSGTLTNFVEMGQARDKILSLKLDQVSGTSTSSGLSTSIDPKGYLTSLDSVVIKTDAEIGDIKRARMLFDSLVKSNPKHSPGWIAAACLEEHAGRMVAARKIIKQGCEQCPKSEDVWLEAARLHNNDDAKVVLANAVQHVGQSVKIWLAAADLEHDIKAKKRVLRKALEHIPNSVRLWKETVNLESNPVDARIILSRAVEVIPLSVELWLALARLETPEKAKAVLNKARKAVPTSHEIWIAAGRLLEQEAYATEKPEGKRNEELEVVDKTIAAGVRQLRAHGVLLTREQWLKEAERCESEGSPRTCEAIVKATVAMEVEEEDRLDTWMSDAESAEPRGHVGTARAILAYALKVFPDKRALWRRAADLEKAHGTRESLNAILERAVHHCPQAEVLWLMWAKEKWLAGDVPAAREVLERAFVANPESEQIWLAAVKIEAENGELGVARELLVRARTVADTQRIWMKSAVFERHQGKADTALETLATAIKKYPKFAKLYMIQGQIHQDRKNYAAARASYAGGIKQCPKEVTLWILASRLEEADGKSIKARALLDKARLANPGSDVLWAEAVGVEERSGGAAQAKTVLARGLQECPTSGLLWSMTIWSEPRPTRKSRSADALRKAADDPLVLSTVARLFWAERKIEKARQWFERAITANPDVGDNWGWWLKFERQHGISEQQDEVVKKCVAAEPHHGSTWQSIAKDLKNTQKGTKEILELVVAALH
ncbi:PRP1 splicing factor, N-terminal-domain-containing protein [Fomitopsis serialis]|uniref:PRP1 splicing factor, N-terminal-domain-containing protein n=1 Tax=Fomitopsis serialis TaxID=139415 RepID=UPI0020080203|nr:PRP1 splicing factor, N-terminal-domain-containing protein [Neoantrodia serialis]KAH9936195.1 PRP1 splicing factor, N-terminal-domain-containing protein [Neoantrodia serialis]